MYLTIQKWAHSLVLRIFKAVVKWARNSKEYALDGLLKEINKKNIHKEFSLVKPMGKEVWWNHYSPDAVRRRIYSCLSIGLVKHGSYKKCFIFDILFSTPYNAHHAKKIPTPHRRCFMFFRFNKHQTIHRARSYGRSIHANRASCWKSANEIGWACPGCTWSALGNG